MFRLIKLIIEFLNNLDNRNGSVRKPSSIDPSSLKSLKKLAIYIPAFFILLGVSHFGVKHLPGGVFRGECGSSPLSRLSAGLPSAGDKLQEGVSP